MLANAMPNRVIHSFEVNGENLFFFEKSVSIESISLHVKKEFDKNTTEEFTFYNDIFNRFDKV